jgi:hypothetical protein
MAVKTYLYGKQLDCRDFLARRNHYEGHNAE